MSSSPLVVMMIMASIVVVVFQADVAQGINLPPPPRQPVTYFVGDSPGWSTKSNLARWLIGKTFRVGDKLRFVYSASYHNVYQVGIKAYDKCKPYGNDKLWTTGNDVIWLTNQGTFYFICSYPGTCASGMKLKVTVIN